MAGFDFDFHIDGLSEINKVLNELGPELTTKVMRTAARAGGKVIAEEISARVPVGQYLTHAKVNHTRKNGTSVYRAQMPGTAKRSIVVKVGEITERSIKILITNRGIAFYLMFLEWGTKHISGKHYFYRGMEASADEAIRVFRDTLIKGVARVTARLAGKHRSNKRRRAA